MSLVNLYEVGNIIPNGRPLERSKAFSGSGKRPLSEDHRTLPQASVLFHHRDVQHQKDQAAASLLTLAKIYKT